MSEDGNFAILPGLPPYGPLARAYPESFSKNGKEGYVVEFLPGTDKAWICNFAPGIGGLSDARLHPNKRDVLVFAAGTCVSVNPWTGEINNLVPAAFQVFKLDHPDRLLISNQDLEFTCIGKEGILWESAQISWDGFKDLTIQDESITGLSWDVSGSWIPFSLDLQSGKHTGGSWVNQVSDEKNSTAEEAPRINWVKATNSFMRMNRYSNPRVWYFPGTAEAFFSELSKYAREYKWIPYRSFFAWIRRVLGLDSSGTYVYRRKPYQQFILHNNPFTRNGALMLLDAQYDETDSMLQISGKWRVARRFYLFPLILLALIMSVPRDSSIELWLLIAFCALLFVIIIGSAQLYTKRSEINAIMDRICGNR
jgi:hypothetical protein